MFLNLLGEVHSAEPSYLLMHEQFSQELEIREARSEPAVYRRAADSWPALSKWPGPAGIEYLTTLHGDSIVDVAVSADTTFSGDVRHAHSTTVPLRYFLSGSLMPSELDGGSQDCPQKEGSGSCSGGTRGGMDDTCVMGVAGAAAAQCEAPPDNVTVTSYLAQVRAPLFFCEWDDMRCTS